MKKASEILQALTLEEKASLCQGATFWLTKEIADKGIPEIMMTDGPPWSAQTDRRDGSSGRQQERSRYLLPLCRGAGQQLGQRAAGENRSGAGRGMSG